ncbi:PRC-barrel domain-containing protein [Megamonas funiformis]|uniref:PRC-barrel domain-containing protein n=1 Tax=Megamonas funiformis TaxID=437897 RepID=UPI002670B42E|nr:PRC-barrel domain-containing protein [Megamonas funiformis]
MTTYESKQLLKSVMSITEGIELGTVSDIIIDGENKKVIALGITKDKLFYKALRVIPFEKISSINEDNILVMSSKDIISYKDFNLDLEKILQDRINILNTICLSGGKKCGTVTEYTIDEQGNILNCKIIYEKTVNVKDINIFAKDYTIMKNIDNTEVISTKKINNTTTKQNEPIQKTTVTQSTNQNTNNEKNIDDNDLNYRLYLV